MTRQGLEKACSEIGSFGMEDRVPVYMYSFRIWLEIPYV